MSIKLNAGAGPTWRKEGWAILDHKVKKNTATVIEGEAININLEDLSCSTVFSSHMLEHIPHVQIEAVLSEFHRVLKEDGILRIVVPDMFTLARAYVNRDADFFKAVEEENETVRTDLGYGGMLANHFVGPGQDTVLFNRQLTRFIAGYSHLYMYDFEMLKILLSKAGFYNILRRSFCCSDLSDYEEPFHVEGLEPVWRNLNQEFYRKHNLIHHYDPETGKYSINFKTTGFDRNPLTSLFVECKKTRTIGPKSWPVYSEGRNYNHYSQSLLKDEKFRLKCEIIEAVNDIIEESTR